MNREIKFRAWFKREKRMIYSPMAISGGIGNDGWVLITAWIEGMDCNKAVYGRPEFEIMQFTGLKDEQGREVYEGDIVECAAIGVRAGVVTWMDPGLFYGVVRPGVVHGMYNGWTVIGNSYENPELIEEQV